MFATAPVKGAPAAGSLGAATAGTARAARQARCARMAPMAVATPRGKPTGGAADASSRRDVSLKAASTAAPAKSASKGKLISKEVRRSSDVGLGSA